MHPNEETIRAFYTAFATRDCLKMVSCYHLEIKFSDPAFPMLVGAEATAMWAMLLSRGKDLQITLVEAHADDSGGRARWEARYTFSQTGRPVHNVIDALFAFRDGKIVRHVDRFSFWRWSSQALGPAGLLFGWSWPLKALFRRKAAASLAGFMAKSDWPRPG